MKFWYNNITLFFHGDTGTDIDKANNDTYDTMDNNASCRIIQRTNSLVLPCLPGGFSKSKPKCPLHLASLVELVL